VILHNIDTNTKVRDIATAHQVKQASKGIGMGYWMNLIVTPFVDDEKFGVY
jgi:hypothetical protein